MSTLLAGYNGDTGLCFIDDTIVYTRGDFDKHLFHVSRVISTIRKAGLKLKGKKCEFAKTNLEFLGHVVSGDGMAPNPKKLEGIRNLHPPRSQRGVRSILGHIGYYRRFIPSFASAAEPLFELLKENTRFHWLDQHQKAFEELRDGLLNSKVLRHPDFTKPFKLTRDASAYGIGSVLSQEDPTGGFDYPVAFISRTLNSAERNYHTTEREALAVIWSLRKFRHYVLGLPVHIVTDHAALKFILQLKNTHEQLSHRLARWALEIQEYKFTMEVKPGRQIPHADGLSREPYVDPPTDDEPVETQRLVLHPEGELFSKVRAILIDRASEAYRALSITLDSVSTRSSSYSDIEGADLNVTNQAHIRAVGDSFALPPPPRRPTRTASEPDLRCLDEPMGSPNALPAPPPPWHPLYGTRPSAPTPADFRADQLLSRYPQLDLPDFRVEQLSDNQLEPVIQFLERGTLPTDNDLLRMLPVWTEQFFMHRDLRYHRQPRSNSYPKAHRQLVVPRSLRVAVLKLTHDGPQGGHMAAGKLYLSMRTRFFWPHMCTDLEQYVASCWECQKHKRGVRRRLPLQPFEVTAPLQRVHVDFMGSYHQTDAGNKYILCIVDAFTKFPIAEPLPTADAKITARVFVDRFINLFGVPEVFVSDRGSNFTPEIFQEILQILGIEHALNAPYHHETSGQVENFNRTLRNMFKCYVDRFQTNWDTFIQGVCMAYRDSIHVSSKESPYRAMFGRDPILPVDVLYTPGEPSSVWTSTGCQFQAQLHDTWALMREELEKAQIVMKRNYDRRARPSDVVAGGLVLVENHRCPLGLTRKLCPQYDGLYRVLRIEGVNALVYALISTNANPSLVRGSSLRTTTTAPAPILNFRELVSRVHPGAIPDNPGADEWYCPLCSRQYSPDATDITGWVQCDTCLRWVCYGCLNRTTRMLTADWICPPCSQFLLDRDFEYLDRSHYA